MISSALSIQCALYTAHCRNIMHSRKPSYVVSTPLSVNTRNRYFYIRGNKIRHILLKCLCFFLCTWINRVMFERPSVDLKTSSVPFTRACNKVRCVAIVTAWSCVRLWRHCWRKQQLGRVHYTDSTWDLCMDFTFYFFFIFLIILYSMLLKGFRMVARAFWRSKALRVLSWSSPCTSRRRVGNLAGLWSPQLTGNLKIPGGKSLHISA